ncbi:two-component system, OmpR family, sensor kinase [Azotobacter beijerinckii]|uniref:histidine kinase n=1 Tax=Azotobacter beijerinckii TaxID=170623 RepID=A0A1H6YZ24_9GAMM|nr:ATP-binding protein [Azotobacter beijerinckii]SEJ46461.1 two-component system, OmpR family, sensor kinase [Azotobacter beijerinckii]
MAGFKKRLTESIQLRLSFTLSLAILIVAVAAGVFSFMSAFEEAHELQDDVLRQIALLMDRQHLSPGLFVNDGYLKESDEESRVIVQRLDNDAQSSTGVNVGKTLPLPTTLLDGLNTLEVGDEPFRVLVRTMATGERIAIAQGTAFRDEIARDSALYAVVPFLILVPILLLLVANLVRKMFHPIAVLAREIDQRADQELHPLSENHFPTEIRPFVVAINRLLARVAQSMEIQRRFVADAAHELRSPLTALSLQAERLAEAEMSDTAHKRLGSLRQGIERNRNLLDQLLTLAKVQSSSEPPKSSVSVQHIYRRVLEDFVPLAEAKHIDIGVEGDQDVQIQVSELDMITVVKNLVDNAIRYTPEGGRVDLSVSTVKGCAVLRIRDTGPGIQLSERERVFDPFYRVLGSDQIGSGLGLSIVRAISERIGAEVRLTFDNEVSQSGLCVSVLVSIVE